MNNAKNTNIFPYLERLLEGETVEWKTIGEVCDIVKSASKLKSGDYCVSGKVPIIDQGAQYIAGYTDKELATIPKDEYIIFGDHTETIKFVDFEFVQGADGLKILHTQKALSKYVYYAFSNFYKKTASYKRHWSKAKETSIPLPPLRVQARIVEILDKFTQLEAELQAELEARRKQYAYYRDQLLNFSQYPPLNVNVEWRTLGEVMEIVTDFTAAGSFASNAQNVRYLQEPNYALLVRTTDIKQGFKGTEKFIYVDQHAFEYLWRVNLDKECIILPNVGNCGEVYHSSPTILPYKNCVLGPNAILVRSEKASNKFLYYLFQAEYFQKELAKITSNAGQGKFNKTNLKQIKLPLPPLSEQRRIVDLLDRFDTLTNSISEGLPKEIALRRKQYEYYRDALLNFPRAEVTA